MVCAVLWGNHMFISIRSFGLICLVMILSACSLPRGAALQSEILHEREAETPTFQVVRVTRESVDHIRHWPATGWSGQYRWFSTSTQPDSSIIQTGDLLNVVIWDSDDNSLLAASGSNQSLMPPMEVSSSGTVFLPYVGDVAVRGLTVPEARQRLQDSIAQVAGSAQVQLSVEEGRNNSIDLVGGVASPGRYPLETRNTKIMTALALSGGINESLRHPLVRLQRGGQTYETRAKDLLADASRNVVLRGGDLITVVEDDRNFNVIGAANTESVIYFQSERMSAMQALSEMGGISDARANPQGVLILREYEPDQLAPGTAGPDMQQVVFTIDLTTADGLFAARQFQIHPQDTVLPTESVVTSFQTILRLFGDVLGFSARATTL